MSDVAERLLVADVPAGVAVDRVSRALIHRRFYHVTDHIGPVVRLWVYCPGDPCGARSSVRHIIEAALADQRTPMPVVFSDEQLPEPPATHPRSPIRGSSLRRACGEGERKAAGSSLMKAG